MVFDSNRIGEYDVYQTDMPKTPARQTFVIFHGADCRSIAVPPSMHAAQAFESSTSNLPSMLVLVYQAAMTLGFKAVVDRVRNLRGVSSTFGVNSTRSS